MWVVHQRIAELWYEHLYGSGLTEEEKMEFRMCLDANLRKAQKLADLYNQSLIASMSNDYDWQHEICKEIQKIEESMK
jgi:hypothetical protein